MQNNYSCKQFINWIYLRKKHFFFSTEEETKHQSLVLAMEMSGLQKASGNSHNIMKQLEF